MRALVATFLVLTPALTYADSNLEVAGGMSIPVGDSNWTNIANTSGKLGVRLGELWGDFGVMLQLDWTPISLSNSGFNGGEIFSASGSANVFRVLIDFAYQHHLPVLQRHLVVSGRFGLGIDIAHASAEETVAGTTNSTSGTDPNIAIEFGGGVAYDFGHVQLGVELALPISNHSHAADSSDRITFEYASWDIDLLGVIRFRM
jgi:hypothetical protein